MLQNVVSGLSYLGTHPLLLARAARNAVRREISVPLALLRWAIDRRPRGKGPERIELYPADPALGLSLTVDLYGTKITVAAKIEIESVESTPEELKVTLRVRDLDVAAPPNSPAAMMVKSLDLSRPGNLLNLMPMKHAALVSAKDDELVLDLLKIPALAKNAKLRRALAALSFIRVRGVRSDGELVAVGLDVNPLAIPAALGRARAV